MSAKENKQIAVETTAASEKRIPNSIRDEAMPGVSLCGIRTQVGGYTQARIDHRTYVLYDTDMERDEAQLAEYGSKLQRFFDSRKRMPSFSELMALWGYKTKSAVNYRVEQLLEAGFISKDRSGRLLPQWGSGIKMLGLVEAGLPSPAEEQVLDVVNLDDLLTSNKEATYILKVKGDSMIDAGIQPGDMVVVERTSQYKLGSIVVAHVDGEYTMKYLRKKSGTPSGVGYFLEPANKNYKPIYPTESFRVEAVVRAVVRKY